MLPTDLTQDLPSFLKRFGSDERRAVPGVPVPGALAGRISLFGLRP
jgi:hypothetical protein